MSLPPIVAPAWLDARMNEALSRADAADAPEPVARMSFERISRRPLVILDARSGPERCARYVAGHLAGAYFADLERDLSTPPSDAARGGRHPLPALDAFCATLGRWGITPRSDVVIYDDQGGANAAARAWWMLRAVGHARVAILDGGFPAAEAAGLPLTTDVPDDAGEPDYPASAWALGTVDYDAIARGDTGLLIDARAPARHRGEVEPIDPVPGHIAGSVNLFHGALLDESGRYRGADEIRALLEGAFGDTAPDARVVSCGSGVTACQLLVGCAIADLPLPALYVGSYSEWCRRQREVAS